MKNKSVLITTSIMIIATVVLVGWDVVVAVNAHNGDTISEIITKASGKYVLIPVVGGTITGHWWSPLQRPLMPWWLTLIILAAHVLGLLAWHLVHVFWFQSILYAFLQHNLFTPFMYGVVLGILTWTQERTET